jgi:hypothetical protein
MRLTRTIASAAAVAAVLVGGLPLAGADTALVDYTCDLPAGATGTLASQIPDTVAVDDMEVTVADTPDPVLQGQNLHLDLDVPFPDFTAELPSLPFGTYGLFRIRQIDITQPLPAGLNVSTVTASLTPTPTWASVTRQASNLKIHIQSPVAGSYIEVNPDVTPPTITIEEAPGHRVPLDFIPSVDVDAIVNGAPGSAIQWTPPTLNAVVKYSKFIPVLINVNWNDANTPCTPNDPAQVIVSTLVASPSMSPTLSRTEATVTVGQTIHYTATIPNTGDVPLTGVSVSIPSATCATPPVSIAVAASATVGCTHVAGGGDLGTYTRSATVDTAETAPTTTGAVSTTVGPRRVVDATIGAAVGGPFTGDGVYSGTVTTAQTVKGNVARGATRTFYVQVGNDGDAADSLTVRGVNTGAAGYKVKYFDASGLNVTPAVKAGTYVVPNVAAGASVTLRVTIKATTASTRGAAHNADVRVTSAASSSVTDIVRAKAKRT